MKHILFSLFVLGSVLTTHAQNVSLTFQVDMSQESISGDGVHVAGDFQSAAGGGNNWNPGATALSDPDGDQIYSVTVMVPPGTYLYKFINGSAWGDKPELPAEACAIHDGGGNFNRQVTVGGQGINLPAVVFDSCNATLRLAVNMNNEQISPQGVHVMGDFQEAAGFANNWNAGATPMEDANMDGVYEVLLPVPAGTYQYIFVNGNSDADREIIPNSCTVSSTFGWQVRSAEAVVEQLYDSTFCFGSCQLCPKEIDTNYDTHWWNDAVFYEIFVRSFYDSDGDGIGDFQGIIQNLDYLNDGDPNTDDDLGITGIWLMPTMPSPSYHGYDVTDYYGVESDYGTMADFEAFLDAAHARGIKVIIDYVMNHSSSQHPWFTQSANSQNGYRDWYRWSSTKPNYLGPWGQEVWHARGGDYFYGLFWGGMPDLNYSHPPVKAEMFDIAKFWLNKGVDGFRLDAIKYLDEDGNILENTAETFQLLEDFNTLYKNENSDAITVGEVWSNTASVLPYIQNDRLDVCFEFDLAYSIINAVNGRNPTPVYNHLQTIQAGYPKLQYATFLTNHDIDRIYSQFGSNSSSMKLAASIYLTLPGIPFVYYGEELGMIGTGRHENIRRPMQWTSGTHAGFSSRTPWYPLGANYAANNVEDMARDNSSLLNHYKRLIHARNEQAPLRRGYFLPTQSNNNDLLSYARVYEEEAVIVIANMELSAADPELSLPVSSLPAGTYQVVELLSEDNWGSLTIDANGGFQNWKPNTAMLAGRDSWVILLSQDPQVSVEEEIELGVEVFPNPADNQVVVRWEKGEGLQTDLQLLDMRGKLIKKLATMNQQVVWDTSDLAGGVYFIRIQQGNRQLIKQIIIGK